MCDYLVFILVLLYVVKTKKPCCIRTFSWFLSVRFARLRVDRKNRYLDVSKRINIVKKIDETRQIRMEKLYEKYKNKH